MDTQLKKLEEQGRFEEPEIESPPQDVVVYNELRSCHDLARLVGKGVLDLSPDYQRDVVWYPADQTKFIDSLLKQMPIPSLCFSYDNSKQKFQVIDGVQRMSTIFKFLDEDTKWKLSKLDDKKNIDRRINGKKVSDIRASNPEVVSRIENLTLPVTILRCDYDKPSHTKYVSQIFHRLNAGGIKLNGQEIRNAVYRGPYMEMIKRCDSLDLWRSLFSKHVEGKPYKSLGRMKGAELVTRYFAFLAGYTDFDGNLASFLEDYCIAHVKDDEVGLSRSEGNFGQVIDCCSKIQAINQGGWARTPNVVVDAVLHGIGANIETISKTPGSVDNKYQKLINDELLSPKLLHEGTMKPEKVKARLRRARDIFSE